MRVRASPAAVCQAGPAGYGQLWEWQQHGSSPGVREALVEPQVGDHDMAMTFDVLSHKARPIPPAGVRALLDEEGWWPSRTEGNIASLLALGPAVGARDGQELIAFARAVTDGEARAYLEDVVVKRDHRGGGIGTELVRRLHRELGADVTVSAFFHPSLGDFYRRLGYVSTRQVVAHRHDERG